jgi:hypothetical protein
MILIVPSCMPRGGGGGRGEGGGCRGGGCRGEGEGEGGVVFLV